MRMVFWIAMIILLFSGNIVSAQMKLPEGPNVNNEWSYEGMPMDDVRIFYIYRSDDKHCACRLDYYYDGRIRLLVTQSYYHLEDSPLDSVTTFYLLRPTTARNLEGKELLRISYKILSGPDLKVEPSMTTVDPFTQHCVPLLDNLFKLIPAAEVKMWKDQYGSLFDLR